MKLRQGKLLILQSLAAVLLLGLSTGCGIPAAETAAPQPESTTGGGMQGSAASTPIGTLAPGFSPQDAQVPANQPTPQKPNECPGLDSNLYAVYQAADPLADAAEKGITIQGGRIQVLLLLENEDTSFLDSFDAQVGTQIGTQVQVFVAPGQLCDLANRPETVAVRTPAKASP